MRRQAHIRLMIGLAIIAAITLLAVLAPWVAPNDPYQVDLSQKLQGFSAKYPLGTDQLGRCVFSRLLYGARQSLGAAVIALVATVFLGSIMGFISGFAGKFADRLIMWVCDVVLAFPGTLLALVIVGYFGSGMPNLVIAIAAVSWAGYAVNIRSMVMTQKSADYVRLAVVGGCSKGRIVLVHILPNVMMPALTLSISSISSMIMRVAALSFIGLGARLPQAEWGLMVNSSREVLYSNPNLMITSVGAIFLTAFGLNLIGDALRDKFDPNAGG